MTSDFVAHLPHIIPPLNFPPSLPVCARRDEIARAIELNQVVIVCGETGSGKTTQLPKIALHLGRGRGAGGKGLIGHTQPRRIAASSVAKRIAHELGSVLGEHVGFKVRFQDRLSAGASVKLMTDGILLAETQSDPLLRAYDTLIIDEAHERSLNIDFLLGYLRQILPRRPDLKVIVTSATIDANRFAQHFSFNAKPAPVIEVSGRVFPVEQRWRPFKENNDYGLNEAITDAVTELWRAGSGDILVFLPGEREIREVAHHLQHHQPAWVEVMPLFARLSQQEQDRVFDIRRSNARRIVLATNVAETSLTVPGIEFVIDVGTARVKRYNYRSKVEQLQIEAISQAAANQRAGRCGRVHNGICIRLYDEADFLSRPRFTDPEILRSSLAAVILRMKSLGLGSVEEFPFLEAPPRRAIVDGYQLLGELGAVDEKNDLTQVGQELVRLPLDPRVGRMILAARDNQALTEVLIIAASLSVQDARDRPLDRAPAADEAHKKFDDEKSEFLGTLKLWKWLEAVRGGQGEHKRSNRQQEQMLKESFISARRVREWRDTHSQLLTLIKSLNWPFNSTPATYEQLHVAMLCGLLGNIGCKSDEDPLYLGARGIKFHQHPGSHLSKKPGRWVVACELVETTRLFGRGLANIDVQWLPKIAEHVIKKQLLDPHWEKKAAEVVALERATLYGLVIYNNRRVHFGRIDPVLAREIFIREALVAGQWSTPLPFWSANQASIRQVQELEHKARRQDVLVDDELIYAFYDEHLPADICNGRSLERWYRDAVREQPALLQLTREALMRHEAGGITSDLFPKNIRLGGIDCAATYLHDPGDAKDGVSVCVPLFGLNQVVPERCEWLVPGMLKDKVCALLKSLPQRPRTRLVPLPDYAQAFVQQVLEQGTFAEQPLLQTLLKSVREETQLDVKLADFKLEQLPVHLFMHFRVVDEHGRQLGASRHLAQLKAELGGQARSAFQALAVLLPHKTAALSSSVTHHDATLASEPGPAYQHSPQVESAPSLVAQFHTDWVFGQLPELMQIDRGAQQLIGFPALIDCDTHVVLEVFDELSVALTQHRLGLRRLVSFQLREALKYLEKNIPELQKMAAFFMPLGTRDELKNQIIVLALDRAFLIEPLPQNETDFRRCIEHGRGRLNLIAQEVARTAMAILIEYASANRKLKDSRASKEVADDIRAQLVRLMPKKFIELTPWHMIAHVPRYLKAVTFRLDKWRVDATRDQNKMAEIRPLEQQFWRLIAERKGVPDVRLDEFRWLLEELRVSLFAQELKTPQPVSVKRLERVWSSLRT
jgi:ATP-dependent helicase HrpA